ncbi:MAG: 2-amino-4-hydroxy-6-hydroxymethyldihydropteridine diphosphokinase [Melioribacteraceae bacterium]|nr:2-amino-4-hydroxy-6-hydroxymethyldihydropteridine diphosphokinase [Melioribacteraceae bacterium]
MANRSFIGLGSNIENRITYLEQSIKQLNSAECSVVNISSIYETKPYGYTEQNNFLNCVVEISTTFDLLELFEFTKDIENQIGRKKRVRWGPREIDLDILFFNDLVYSDERITVPHKDVLNRDFVLVPLCEIASELIHPQEQRRICEIKLDRAEQNIIRKLDHQFI